MPSAAKIDEGFIARVYRTSAYVWAFGALVAWGWAGPYAALGWSLGCALSVGVLAGIEWIVRRAVRPGNTRTRKTLTNAAALHWPIILVFMGFVFWLGRGRMAYLIAFIAGLGLVQAVIVLKALGILIVQHLNRDSSRG
jgi:hypothetical protein